MIRFKFKNRTDLELLKKHLTDKDIEEGLFSAYKNGLNKAAFVVTPKCTMSFYLSGVEVEFVENTDTHAPQWLSILENKPKDVGVYLVTVDDGRVTRVTTDFWDCTRWACHRNDEHGYVIAFAPLPQPYIEED